VPNAFSLLFSALPNQAKCSNLEFDNAFEYDSDVIASETLQAGVDLEFKHRRGETGQ
jgi:hypothetical protein